MCYRGKKRSVCILFAGKRKTIPIIWKYDYKLLFLQLVISKQVILKRYRWNSSTGNKNSTAELSKPIKNLTEMAFIRKEVPFGESEKKTKKTLYQIDDPFMAFYYEFVEPYKSTIAMGRTNIVKQMLERSFHDHVGGIWERICQIKRFYHISCIYLSRSMT